VDLYEFDQRIGESMRGMPPGVRPWVLAWLTASDEQRARAIGTLHEATDGSSLAELLIDLEDRRGEQIRAMMVGYLRWLGTGLLRIEGGHARSSDHYMKHLDLP